MPDLERKALPAHLARSGTTIQTGCAVLFGLPFLANGIFVTLLAGGVVKVQGDKPPAIAIAFGFAFASAGLWVISHGLAGFVRNAGVAHRRAGRPDEPWYWDHRWDEKRSTHGGFGTQIRGWIGIVWFAGFAAPFNWVAWTERHGAFMVGAAILDLLLLAAIGYAVYQFFGWIQHGYASLRLERFPYFLGGRLEAAIEEAERLQGFRSVTLTLRCIEEAFEYVNRSNRVACYQVYEDRQVVAADSVPILGGELRISLPLPKGDHATRLSQRPPR